MATLTSPRQSTEEIAQLSFANLRDIARIDSRSDETSAENPSTPGQQVLSNFLREYFSKLGFATSQDEMANLYVEIPGNIDDPSVPPIVYMTHLDTASPTQPTDELVIESNWDGSRLSYQKNSSLNVSVTEYKETDAFVGQDVVHGPGDAPFGLDDKLGVAAAMTIGFLLSTNTAIKHGPVTLAFRPDEEIGKMAAVQALAEALAERGIKYGYTLDGFVPFEVNVENFEASFAEVTLEGATLPARGAVRSLERVHFRGVESHGATAKSEGHFNSVRAFLELSKRVSGAITPVEFVSDERREVDARAAFLLQAGTPEELHRAREVLAALLHDAIAPGRSRGATVAFLQSEKVEDEAHFTNAALRSASLLSTFIESAKAAPLFPEESEGYEGYSNPCVIEAHGGTARVKFRLRAFSRDELALREEDVRRAALNEGVEAKVTFQYQNMGAVLARYPELVEWAVQAAQSIAVAARKLPIRGGTGVDPFLARGIPVANLGTGYFGLETEKELTSLQSMANHVLWYLNLLQIVGRTK